MESYENLVDTLTPIQALRLRTNSILEITQVKLRGVITDLWLNNSEFRKHLVRRKCHLLWAVCSRSGVRRWWTRSQEFSIRNHCWLCTMSRSFRIGHVAIYMNYRTPCGSGSHYLISNVRSHAVWDIVWFYQCKSDSDHPSIRICIRLTISDLRVSDLSRRSSCEFECREDDVDVNVAGFE